MDCRSVRRTIAEAERPEVLPFEVARHLDICAVCQGISEDRIRLAGLLGSIGRVSAPPNFDELLRARMGSLGVRPGRRRSGFAGFLDQTRGLVPAGYMRTAGVAAAILLAVALGRQVLINREVAIDGGKNGALVGEGGSAPHTDASETTVRNTAADPGMVPPVSPAGQRAPGGVPSVAVLRGSQKGLPRLSIASLTTAPARDITAAAAGYVLMRGPVAERQIAVPMVSIGSQPLFYANDDGRGLRNARASF